MKHPLIPAVFSAFLAVLLLCPNFIYPDDYYRVTVGKGYLAAEVLDPQGNVTQRTQVICNFCHQASATLQGALAKPYDSHSRQNHQDKYFPEKAIKTVGTAKYVLNDDVYLVREGTRLVLVQRSEGFKLTFPQDAVVLIGTKGDPVLIHTYGRAVRTKLPVLPAPEKK